MEEHLEPLPSWDSLLTKLQDKRGYSYQVLKVHQANPTLLEQETKRETQKRDLSMWNFSKKIREKRRPHSSFNQTSYGERTQTQTHDIIDIRVTRQVAREDLRVLFTFSATDVINQSQNPTNHCTEIPVQPKIQGQTEVGKIPQKTKNIVGTRRINQLKDIEQ